MIVLPEEIVEYIISFTCDRRGYNMVHYNKRKRMNQYRMRRLIKEIRYFGMIGYSVGWLRTCGRQKKQVSRFIKSLKEGNPTVTYHTGCYFNSCQERKWNWEDDNNFRN